MQTMHLAIARRRPFVSFKRVGGLYHWRIGRLGGSVYLTR